MKVTICCPIECEFETPEEMRTLYEYLKETGVTTQAPWWGNWSFKILTDKIKFKQLTDAVRQKEHYAKRKHLSRVSPQLE